MCDDCFRWYYQQYLEGLIPEPAAQVFMQNFEDSSRRVLAEMLADCQAPVDRAKLIALMLEA